MKIIFHHRWCWQTQLDSSVCIDNISIEIYNDDGTTNGVVKDEEGCIMKFDSKASVYRYLLAKAGIVVEEVHRVG
jgi:hypothetical protein